MSDRPYRRTEGGDRFSHNTVAVLEAFATSVVMLHDALATIDGAFGPASVYWVDQSYHWARSAVRAARLLTVREDYR